MDKKLRRNVSDVKVVIGMLICQITVVTPNVLDNSVRVTLHNMTDVIGFDATSHRIYGSDPTLNSQKNKIIHH